jgi:hypothetical protein
VQVGSDEAFLAILRRELERRKLPVTLDGSSAVLGGGGGRGGSAGSGAGSGGGGGGGDDKEETKAREKVAKKVRACTPVHYSYSV